ncbi:hypothetical protein PsorP6_012656 [Peronosclerospora sorghi]|uniref:Uncharacterized protein n=1 Tax=Peronosclerospora sorghi TaxID=230839 RepID=A0ACC0WIZ0_9STRA|nr:hypothetical protein PsorP6_012656 [Peronosclerospora sorghi]
MELEKLSNEYDNPTFWIGSDAPVAIMARADAGPVIYPSQTQEYRFRCPGTVSSNGITPNALGLLPQCLKETLSFGKDHRVRKLPPLPPLLYQVNPYIKRK